jgi:small-conductance mechanosensitive channel
MKSIISFLSILVLTGCNTQSPKVYRNKIEFCRPENLKILYARPEAEKLAEECYEINFPDADIAENNLEMQMLYRLNEHNKAFLLKAKKELKEVQKFTAVLKARISERNKQYQQIKELEKQINESKQKIEQLKPGEKK